MRRKRLQREEVRRLLAAVQVELSAQKQPNLDGERPVVHLDEVIQRAKRIS